MQHQHKRIDKDQRTSHPIPLFLRYCLSFLEPSFLTLCGSQIPMSELGTPLHHTDATERSGSCISAPAEDPSTVGVQLCCPSCLAKVREEPKDPRTISFYGKNGLANLHKQCTARVDATFAIPHSQASTTSPKILPREHNVQGRVGKSKKSFKVTVKAKSTSCNALWSLKIEENRIVAHVRLGWKKGYLMHATYSLFTSSSIFQGYWWQFVQ